MEVVEWRTADRIPDGTWMTVDYLLSTEDRTVSVTVPTEQ